MSLFKFPEKVTSKINSILTKFWWQTSWDKNPIYWLKKEVLQQHKHLGGMALKDAKTANKTLLFKQAWRIMRNPTSLVARLYQGIFGKSWFQNAIKGKVKNRGSWCARGLLKNVTLFREGIGKKLGNGQTIDFRHDRWVLGYLADIRAGHLGNQFTRVSDLIKSNQEWDAAMVWNSFTKEHAQKILSIYIPIQHQEDEFIWYPAANREFNTKNGYWWKLLKVIIPLPLMYA